MRIFVTLLITLLTIHSAVAQPSCGTQISAAQRKLVRFLPQQMKDFKAFRQSGNAALRRVAVTAHLIRKSDGSSGITVAEVKEAVKAVNAYYISANLEFFVGRFNEIDNTKYYNFVTSDETEMGTTHDIPNTINIYFANSVSNGEGGAFCGYAYFPGGPDRILMDNSCAVNGSTLSHEIGHFFALYHTHGIANGILTDELVARTNCETTGDELCDTPADPQLGLSNVNSVCSYTGSAVDASGDSYTPAPDNIMSYAPKDCRDKFTSGQYQRMSLVYSEYRSYLYDRNLVADFRIAGTQICTETSLDFSDFSFNATKWNWFFEGGTPAISSEKNPSIIYAQEGMYGVKLVIEDSAGNKDSLEIADVVIVKNQEASMINKTASLDAVDESLRIVNPDDGKTLQYSSAVSAEGTGSVFINFYDYSAIGEKDYLVLPPLDNTFSRNYQLKFIYAYTYYDTNFNDGLAVVYRDKCEVKWTELWSKKAADLATAPPTAQPFVPTSSQWREVSLEFTASELMQGVTLGFETINGYGNNLYLDDIRLGAVVPISVASYACPGEVGGLISINPSGTETYTYSMDDSPFSAISEIEVAESGLFDVKVKDSQGRVYNTSISVENSSVDVVATSTTCFQELDGEVEFIFSNPLDEYTLRINGEVKTGFTASQLSAGEHTFTIRGTETGCEYSNTFFIESPAELVLNVDVSDATCFGDQGSIIAEATGGTGEYAYQLAGETVANPQEIFIGAGDHDLTVQDENGCSVIKSFSISEPDALMLSYETEGFVCAIEPAGTVRFDGSGGIGEYEFRVNGTLLSGKDTLLAQAVDLEVEITDMNGCSSKETISLMYQNEALATPEIREEGAFLVVDSVADAEITWFKDGELLTNEKNFSVLRQSGVYYAEVSIDGSCAVRSADFEVLVLSESALDQIKVYPNPVVNDLTVEVPPGFDLQWVSVYDVSGQLVRTSQKSTFSLNHPKGVYLLKLNGIRDNVTIRVIKE